MQEIKNNPQVYNTQENMEEIKTNPQVYATHEGVEEIKKSPQVDRSKTSASMIRLRHVISMPSQMSAGKR